VSIRPSIAEARGRYRSSGLAPIGNRSLQRVTPKKSPKWRQIPS
jgi:hypothetical protein